MKTNIQIAATLMGLAIATMKLCMTDDQILEFFGSKNLVRLLTKAGIIK